VSIRRGQEIRSKLGCEELQRELAQVMASSARVKARRIHPRHLPNPARQFGDGLASRGAAAGDGGLQ
jgi:hypothetical protein